LSEIFEG